MRLRRPFRIYTNGVSISNFKCDLHHSPHRSVCTAATSWAPGVPVSVWCGADFWSDFQSSWRSTRTGSEIFGICKHSKLSTARSFLQKWASSTMTRSPQRWRRFWSRVPSLSRLGGKRVSTTPHIHTSHTLPTLQRNGVLLRILEFNIERRFMLHFPEAARVLLPHTKSPKNLSSSFLVAHALAAVYSVNHQSGPARPISLLAVLLDRRTPRHIFHITLASLTPLHA